MSDMTVTLPLTGTSNDDVIRVQSSVTFVWIPLDDKWSLTFPLDAQGNHWASKRSTASGEITFDGVSPSENITSAGKLGDTFDFRFTNGTAVSGQDLSVSGTLSWNQFSDAPVIQDPFNNGTPALVVDASRSVQFSSQFTILDVKPPPRGFIPDQYEQGHWALRPDPYDVYVSGGDGDDTIYGGQGRETLMGGAGHDLILVGPGKSQVDGGAGNDTIWGGNGDQLLDGGAGDDTIYVGVGSGYVSGGTGNDYISAQTSTRGEGNQTLMGGAGNDTILAGTGDQSVYGDAGADLLYGGGWWGDETLDGGAGNDTLVGGLGHETLTGGSGRDVFVLVFSADNNDYNRWLDVTDFKPGQDKVEFEVPSNRWFDVNLVRSVEADANGDAVLRLNAGGMVLHGVRPAEIVAQPSKYLAVVADLPSYDPAWWTHA